MRKSRASKSSPPAPTITISPSTTQRSGSVAASGAMSSGKYRFIGFSSRLCSRISSPSRNTNVRKPSHLGSNCHPSPPGKASAALDNIGARGGAKGRRMAQYSRRCLIISFELLNRNVDQPFKYVATWLIDAWSKIGLHVTQRVCRRAPGSTNAQQPRARGYRNPLLVGTRCARTENVNLTKPCRLVARLFRGPRERLFDRQRQSKDR